MERNFTAASLDGSNCFVTSSSRIHNTPRTSIYRFNPSKRRRRSPVSKMAFNSIARNSAV